MKFINKLLQFWADYKVFRATVKSWFGEGGRPVSSDISQARADMCLSCAYNRRGIVSQEMVSNAARRLLEAKNRLKMSVQGEEGLHTCKLCNCLLKIKIHVPLRHIRAYQPESVRQNIIGGKPSCWQLKG